MTIRVGFLSSQNYHSRTAFSGTLFSMHQALKRRPELEVVDLGYPASPTLRRRIQRRLVPPPSLGSGGFIARTRWRARIYRQLLLKRPNVVFAPQGSLELAVHRPSVPYVYSSDCTYELLAKTYELGHSSTQANNAQAAERHAIVHATRCHYPSRWAAQSAIESYGADPDSVDIIPYGGNLTSVPNPENFDRPEDGPLRLLFVGRDWVRKGGQLALDGLAELRQRGLDVQLTIVGCTPPEGTSFDGLRVIEYINKDVPEEAAELNRLYLTSHFLLFPTRADCSPISLCEAAAYGLVAVASDAGGISDIVANGETGFVLPLDAPASSYADRIESAAKERARVLAMGRAARRRFDQILNWDAWAFRMVEAFRKAAKP